MFASSRAEHLRQKSRGSPSLTVCILDGPLDLQHEALAGSAIAERWIFGMGPTQPSTHGTSVAGIIFGDSADTHGMVPDCKGLSIPIWGSSPQQLRVCSQQDLAQAIDLAAEMGARVINISGGELSPGSEISPELLGSVERCLAQGVLVVAAVGNEGCLCPHVPAIIPGVLAVGAMDEQGAVLPFSNWASAYNRSGLLAPGKNLTTARLGGGSHTVSGTSYAAALVSGAVAWLMSVQLDLGLKADALAMRDLLLETADACDPAAEQQCERVLAGRMNIAAALERLESSTHAGSTGLIAAAHSADVIAESEMESAPCTFRSACVVQSSELENPESADVLRTLSSPPTLNRSEKEMTELSLPETPANEILAAAPATVAVGPASPYPQAGVSASGVEPSGCGCGCDKDDALVYVVGTIGYDFGSRAKYDSFAADMAAGGKTANPYDPAAMVAYLAQNPFAAPDLVWTLNVESIPVYAVQPMGAYSSRGYELLAQLLSQQSANAAGSTPVRMVSVPGKIRRNVALQSGQEVPVIVPALRGVSGWSVDSMIDAAVQSLDELAASARKAQYTNFFQRFFYELRNLGRTSAERAINFGGTTIFNLGAQFTGKIEEELVLHRIEVSKSLICPPGGDCWDVSMIFFSPKQMLERSREVLRFTVDVSQEIPVRVGAVNSWATYSGVN
jgi:cyanobactin maturation PatA/PatG family protease